MNRKTWTEDEVSIITTYLRNRVPIKQIAKKFDVTTDSIYGVIRRNNLSEQIIPKASSALFIKNIDFGDLQEESFEELKAKAKLQWQIAKTKKINKNKAPFKTALFWPDTHIPHHNPTVVKAILKLMDDICFDKVVICGDFMDLGCISHWNRNRHKTLEMKRLKADYIIGNSMLDEIDKRVPKNCDKYFLEGNHESVSKDTRILTEKGWILASGITKKDKIGQFDMHTGAISFSKPLLLHKHFSKNLISVESTYSKQAVTLKHDVVIKDKKIKANKLLNYPINAKDIRLVGSYTTNKLKINYDELALLTWVIMDGTIINYNKYNPKSKKVRVQFKLARNDKIEKLRKLLNKMGIEYTFKEATKSGVNKLQPYYIRIYGEYARKINTLLNNRKQIPEDWKSLNKKQTEIVLKNIIDTDGGVERSRYYWKTTSLNNLNIITFLCAKHGYIYNWRKEGYSGFTKNGKIQYRMNFYLKETDYNYVGDVVNVSKIEYNDYAYCVTMPKGTIITELNGKIAFTGNCWANDLLEEMPALEGMIEPKSMLFLDKRGYKFHEYNKLIKFGRLYITHGIYATMNSIKKHIDELKVNVLFGHTHTLGMQLFSSPARQIAFAGYNIGCVCDLAPDYMRNKPNKWTHGFAVGYFYDNGYFDIELIRVVNGRFVFNSKMYDGNS